MVTLTQRAEHGDNQVPGVRKPETNDHRPRRYFFELTIRQQPPVEAVLPVAPSGESTRLPAPTGEGQATGQWCHCKAAYYHTLGRGLVLSHRMRRAGGGRARGWGFYLELVGWHFWQLVLFEFALQRRREVRSR